MSSYSDVFLNFVGGQWKQGTTGQWESNRNPARPAEIIGKATRSSAIDAARAVEIAQAAQAEWANRPRAARAAMIAHATTLLKSRAEVLAKTISREQGKNLTEARAEVTRTLQTLECISSEGRQPNGAALELFGDSTLAGWAQLGRAPLGVVVILGSWNLPALGTASRVASALLEGNSVVLKPSSLTSATAALVVRAFEEASLPAGTLNLVYGSGAALASTFVDDPRVSALTFEGGPAIARELRMRAAGRSVPPRLSLVARPESAALVLADADVDTAADALCAAAFGAGAGATGLRSSPLKRLFVEAAVFEDFTHALVSRCRALTTGDGIQNPTALGPLPDERRLLHALELLEEARREGASVLCGGERVGATSAEGFFLAPTILTEFALNPANSTPMRIVNESFAGPILLLERSTNLEEAIFSASKTVQSFAVFGKDFSRAIQLSKTSHAPWTVINASPASLEAQAACLSRDGRLPPSTAFFSRQNGIAFRV